MEIDADFTFVASISGKNGGAILAASRFYYSRRGSAKKISRIFSDFPRAKNKYGVSKRVRAGGYWETAAWDLQRVLAEIFDRPKKCQKLKI